MDGNDTSQVRCYVKEDDDVIISNEVESDDGDIPERGMRFNSYDGLYDYCEDYAKKSGWAIRKRSNPKKEGAIKYVQLVCSRALRGKSPKESEPISSQITGCFARIRAVLKSDGEYNLTTVCLEHNHPLCPTTARRIRQYRELDQHSKDRFCFNEDAGVRQSKSYHAILTEKGGYANLGYSERDARNFIDKRRRLKLQSGDADALHRYFIMMQKNNPNFFYSMDLDEEGRLRNLFWADARSRAACEDFQDFHEMHVTSLKFKKVSCMFLSCKQVSSVVIPNSSIGSVEVGKQCGTNETTPSISILERQVLDYVFDKSVVQKKELVSCIDGYSINSNEIATLQGSNWLGSQVLNMYIKLINLDRETNDRYVFLTFLASHGQYIRRLPKNSKTPSQRLRDAKRLFSQQCRPSRCGYNIFNCKWLIFPICLHSHWLAFTINLTEYRIEILDSLFDKMLPGLDKIIDGVLIILEELSKDFGGVIFDHKMYSTDIIPLAKVVKQTNTWDCGVLLIKIMESWYGKMTTEINKDMTDKYRLQIASSIILSQHNEIKDEIIKKATERTTNL